MKCHAPRFRFTPTQWVGVFLAAVFVLSVLRVVTGANDIDSSGLLIAGIDGWSGHRVDLEGTLAAEQAPRQTRRVRA